MDVNYRIEKLGGGIAIALALAVDLCQLGLNAFAIGGIINPFIITPTTYLGFWVWFMMKGVKFGNPKNIATIGIGSLIEAIPYIDALPGLTVMVARIIINTRIEDAAKGGGLVGKLAGGATQPTSMPRNQPVSQNNLQSTAPFNQNQPPRQPANLNDIRNPASEPKNIASVQNIKPQVAPVNLAAEPDYYREAA